MSKRKGTADLKLISELCLIAYCLNYRQFQIRAMKLKDFPVTKPVNWPGDPFRSGELGF